MKISVSGIVGSGKSTVSKLLAQKLGFSYFSVGGIMRQMAMERGISLPELTEIAKSDGGIIDRELDQRQIDIGRTKKDFVMDSRLGFHFIPDSFKIFLFVNIDEAAKRIFLEGRKEESYKNIEEAKSYLQKRILSEKQRFMDYYELDFPDGCDFDLKIDTSNICPEEVVEKILSFLPNQGRYEQKA